MDLAYCKHYTLSQKNVKVIRSNRGSTQLGEGEQPVCDVQGGKSIKSQGTREIHIDMLVAYSWWKVDSMKKTP